MISKVIPVLEDIFLLNSEDLSKTEIVRQCFDIVDALIVVVDLKGNIAYVNRKGCEILEYAEEEIKGKDWISEYVVESKRHEARSMFGKMVDNKNGIADNFLYRIKSGSGKQKFVEAKHVFIHDKASEIAGFLISGEDVTEYLHIQKKLQYSINLHRNLAGNIPDINMYLFDQELRYIIAEGSEMKIHSLSSEYFEGKKLDEILDEEIRSILIPLYQAALEGKEISTEYSYKGYDYLIWVFPLKNDDNQVYAGMAITQNITEEKQTAERLKKTKDIAIEANKAKSEFLANVSHEIRTPLNAIIGFTEQLLKTGIDTKQEEFLRIIENASEHLLSLVNEILMLSKIEAGEIRFDKVPFKVASVINDVFSTLKIKADQKKINFKYDIDPVLDRYVIGDHFRLRQILMNITGNAIKFTDSGYVEINCFCKDETDDRLSVRFDISDTGIGISEDKLGTIFEQFKQADSTVTKRFGGTGLGLTISKKLTELQKGSISVSSKPGVGTQFTVMIPYKKGNKEDVLLAGQTEDIDRSILSDISALLIDDDSVNRLLGKTILEQFGVHVDLAINGDEAMEKLKVHGYDLLLLDIHMPGTGGIDVARYVRNELKNTKVRIVAVTAAVMKEDIEQYEREGIDDFLIKPYKEINLYNKICTVLNKNAKTGQLSKEEIILKKKTQDKLYDLSELRRIAGDNNEFFSKMLNTFINNAVENIEKLEKYSSEGNREQIREIAHKMLPSFRHLRIQSVIKYLTDIQNNADEKVIASLLKQVVNQTKQVIIELEQENKKEIEQD